MFFKACLKWLVFLLPRVLRLLFFLPTGIMIVLVFPALLLLLLMLKLLLLKLLLLLLLLLFRLLELQINEKVYKYPDYTVIFDQDLLSIGYEIASQSPGCHSKVQELKGSKPTGRSVTFSSGTTGSRWIFGLKKCVP